MPDAILTQLEAERECEGLLECMLGLKTLDRQVFKVLVESADPLTVDELAARIDRERTTAYRSVKRLQEVGIAHETQENCDRGGYHHVYGTTDPDAIADGLQRLLNDWYANTGQLIQEFRDTYSEPRPPEIEQ